jgi:hypothetical protein
MKNQKTDFESHRHKYIENDQETGKAQLTKEGRVYLRWRKFCRKYRERFGQCAPENIQRDLWQEAEQELAAE